MPSLVGVRAGPSPAVLSFLAPFDTSKWGASRGPAFRCARSSRSPGHTHSEGPEQGPGLHLPEEPPDAQGPAPGCASDEKEAENGFWRGHRERF